MMGTRLPEYWWVREMQRHLLSLMQPLQEEKSFKTIASDIKSQATATSGLQSVLEEQYRPKQAYEDGLDMLVSLRIAGTCLTDLMFIRCRACIGLRTERECRRSNRRQSRQFQMPLLQQVQTEIHIMAYL